LAFVWRSRRSPLIDLLVELGLGFRPTHGKYTSLSPWLRLIKTKFNLHLSLLVYLVWLLLLGWRLLLDLTPITKLERELQLRSLSGGQMFCEKKSGWHSGRIR